MKLKNIVTINAILVFLFGAAFALLPGTMMEAYGVTQVPSGWAFSRLLGVSLLSLGIVLWSVKNVVILVPQRELTTGLLMANLIGLFFTLLQQQAIWSIDSSLAGWLTVTIYLGLSIGYGWLLLLNNENTLSANNA